MSPRLRSRGQDKMTYQLLIGIVALAIGAGLLVIALPNRYGESPRFLQFYAAPMVYPPIVLICVVLGVAELIAWVATLK
jgi:hypothetical protein